MPVPPPRHRRLARQAVFTVLSLMLVLSGPLRPTGASYASSQAVNWPSQPAAPAGSHTVYLPMVVRSGQAQPGLSSAELIDAAVAAEEIDAEIGLVYKVLAAFGDPRLPAKYRGDDSKLLHAHGVREAAAAWDSLSPESQHILAPFFQPPLYQESWLGQQQAAAQAAQPNADIPSPIPGDNWQSMTAVDGKVRIWWEPSLPGSTQAKAQQIAAILAGTVWPQLTGIMGRTPLPDTGPFIFKDLQGNDQQWGNGGDTALDIYVVQCSGCGGGLTVGYPPGCQARPSFLLIDPRLQNLEAGLAHEFMHVLQLTYNVIDSCSEYEWMGEATGHWAIDYVYPANNYEHDSTFLLTLPRYPLSGGRGYDSWMFFAYLDRILGQPQLLRTIWEKTEQFDSLGAIHAALPGGLPAHWKMSAMYNWNRAPVDDFKTTDELQKGASASEEVTVSLAGLGFRAYTLDVDIQHMAAQYYHYTFTESAISTVVLRHPFSGGAFPTARIQGLVRLEGETEWQPAADWSAQPSVSFCRDVKAERIAELVVIISDHEWQDRGHRLNPTNMPKLEISNIACAGWEGYVQYVHHSVDGLDTDEDPIRSEYNEDFYTAVTFRHAPSPNWLPGSLFLTADADAMTSIEVFGWAWDEPGPPAKCTFLGNDLVDIALERSYLVLLPALSATYWAAGDMDEAQVWAEDSCGNDGYVEIDQTDWWLTGPGGEDEPLEFSDDGRSFTGRYTLLRDDLNWTYWEWEFTALPKE